MELSPGVLTDLLAQWESLPKWEAPVPESPQQVRQRMEIHLRRIITDAEAELTRLGCPPNAWQTVSAYLTDVLPAFGNGQSADLMLGPLALRGGKGPLRT